MIPSFGLSLGTADVCEMFNVVGGKSVSTSVRFSRGSDALKSVEFPICSLPSLNAFPIIPSLGFSDLLGHYCISSFGDMLQAACCECFLVNQEPSLAKELGIDGEVINGGGINGEGINGEVINGGRMNG